MRYANHGFTRISVEFRKLSVLTASRAAIPSVAELLLLYFASERDAKYCNEYVCSFVFDFKENE